MSRKAKQTGEPKNSFQEELESKRKKYREWVEKNPYPMDHGIEMKECEGCYCQMSHNNGYDFCFDCLDSESCGHENYNPDFGNCCFCFDPKSKFKTKKKRKKLTFFQKQRLYWEEVKQKAEDKIEEIKDHEDTGDMLTAKRIEDVKRWSRQEKERTIKDLTNEELWQELIKRKKVKSGDKNKSEPMVLLDEYERNHPYSGCSHCREEFNGNDQDFKKYENVWYCLNCYDDIENNNKK